MYQIKKTLGRGLGEGKQAQSTRYKSPMIKEENGKYLQQRYEAKVTRNVRGVKHIYKKLDLE